MVAQSRYEGRRAVHRKLIRDPDIMAAVRSGFYAGCSPEQIAGRMQLERHPMRVSHETIYRTRIPKTDTLRSSTSISLDTAKIVAQVACVACASALDVSFLRQSKPIIEGLIEGLSPWQKGTVENTNNRLRR